MTFFDKVAFLPQKYFTFFYDVFYCFQNKNFYWDCSRFFTILHGQDLEQVVRGRNPTFRIPDLGNVQTYPWPSLSEILKGRELRTAEQSLSRCTLVNPWFWRRNPPKLLSLAIFSFLAYHLTKRLRAKNLLALSRLALALSHLAWPWVIWSGPESFGLS